MNPDEDYVVLDLGSEYLLLADALAGQCPERYGMDGATVTACRDMYKGRALENILLAASLLCEAGSDHSR